MTHCIEVTIAGARVWDVGYRPFLLMKAIGVGIRNVFAFNQEVDGEETVVIHVSGEREALDRFIQLARSSHPVHAQVSAVDVREFEGDVLDAFQFLQILQFEQINKGIPAILNIEKLQVEMSRKQDKMLEMQEQSLSNQDKMLGMQEQSLSNQDKMLGMQEQSLSNQDKMLGMQDAAIGILGHIKKDTSCIKDNTAEIKEELSRGERWERLEEKCDLLSREIVEIKATLDEIRAKASSN